MGMILKSTPVKEDFDIRRLNRAGVVVIGEEIPGSKGRSHYMRFVYSPLGKKAYEGRN